jgi:hypothetical protein
MSLCLKEYRANWQTEKDLTQRTLSGAQRALRRREKEKGNAEALRFAEKRSGKEEGRIKHRGD